jgi:predicted amidohydrolase
LTGAVRLLLSALRCEKGAVRENLREHERVMREAHDAGCALAVFPEMSLTGSVDPTRSPAEMLALDDPAVTAIAALTAELGVGAVFGISERAERGDAFITQVVADRGSIAGVQRKRHLGDDELAYTADDVDSTFDLGGARYAIAICAEGEVERPFAYAVRSSAKVVLFCAAPGLWGRRIDEAAWQRGWEWWRGHGLDRARRHAREHGLWIALATQAGSTRDEDFPGIAALVDPTGEIRAELSDWHPGALVVDLPV